MTARRSHRLLMRAVPIGVAAILAGAYAWTATGMRPFTTPAYVATAVPVLGLAALVTPRRRGGRGRDPAPSGRRRGVRAALPALALLAAGVGLESLALALGGRSAAVPSLSTVVDHALVWHESRFVLFLIWLAVGLLPGARRARFRDGPGT